MKKYTALVICVIGSFFLCCLPVSAHVIIVDRSISALLHIEPADDPIAGEEAELFFYIRDTKNKFSEDACICTLAVLDQNKTIYKKTLNDKAGGDYGSDTFLARITFPHKGIYHLTLEGKPSTTNGFQSFHMEYDVRVEREKASAEPHNRWQNVLQYPYTPYIAVGILFILFALGLFIHERKKK